MIPADAMAELDIRALPDENMDNLVATLRQLINDPEVKIVQREGGQTRPAPPPTYLDTEMYHALERAQQRVFPGAATLPIMQTGATDSAQLRAKGVQAYGVTVPKTEEDTRRVHGNDERVPLDALEKFVEYLYAAVTDAAGSR